MPYQLLANYLDDIFGYLEDKMDLRLCLLVNHLWCEFSARILMGNYPEL